MSATYEWQLQSRQRVHAAIGVGTGSPTLLPVGRPQAKHRILISSTQQRTLSSRNVTSIIYRSIACVPQSRQPAQATEDQHQIDNSLDTRSLDGVSSITQATPQQTLTNEAVPLELQHPSVASPLNPARKHHATRRKPSLWKSMQEILELSLPLTLTNVSGFTLNCLSDAMIGRLGAACLSTSTLANSFYGMMGISVIWGGAAGMETLAGQAYGAGNLRMMRLVLLRAMLVCWGLCLPMAALWQHAEWLMIKLGQCPTMAKSGAVYLQALVPSLFMYVLAECLQSYMVCQNRVQPATWAKGITAVLGPIFYYVLMFKMKLGLAGAAYAYALCKATNAMLLLGWMLWDSRADKHTKMSSSSQSATFPSVLPSASDPQSNSEIQTNGTSTFQGSSHQSQNGTTGGQHTQSQTQRTSTLHSADNGYQQKDNNSPMALQAAAASTMTEAAPAAVNISVVPDISLREVFDLKGALEYIKYGLPSAAMTMLEWWAYEINVILAGTLPDAEVAVAVLGICLAIAGWVYMFPQSIATATCTRISNSLGGGDARSAQSYFRSAILMVACQQTLLATCILIGSTRIVDFFCHDPAVLTIALGIVPIVAANTLADGMNVTLNGILRACGRQALGARLQLCSYWVVGVPLSWFLGVKAKLGIAGFLTAIGITSFTQAIVCGTVISRFNWKHEVVRAQKILKDMSATMETSAAV